MNATDIKQKDKLEKLLPRLHNSNYQKCIDQALSTYYNNNNSFLFPVEMIGH